MKFNISQSRIKTIVQEIAKDACKFHQQTFKNQKISENELTATSLLTRTLRFFEKKDGLQLVISEKESMGLYISAIFPLSKKIAILKEEYYQILSSDSYWLPVIFAHELGHWVLHAPNFRKFNRQLDLFFRVDKIGSTLEEIQDVEYPGLDILDQQANLFARELILPEENIKEALHRMGYYSPIIYREHHLNLMPFQEYQIRLAEKIHDILQAPIPWLRFRLVELNLLQNQTLKKRSG